MDSRETRATTPAEAFIEIKERISGRMDRLADFLLENFDVPRDVKWSDVTDIAQIAAVLKLACDIAFSEHECET